MRTNGQLLKNRNCSTFVAEAKIDDLGLQIFIE